MLSDKEKLLLIKQTANNVLYFDDSSDYITALWEILEVVNPQIFEVDPEPKLKYIDDEDAPEG